jgi:glutathione synthase/RimK-type ligase-like ATP-grasp enzyme
MRCVFLSQDSMAGYVSDDELAVPAFERLGWSVDTLSWRRDDVRWGDYDAVIVRTTWDYQKAPLAFLEVLGQIDASTRLANPLELMRWNLSKIYLRELETRGVPTVPTEWGEGLDARSLRALADRAGDEFVIKPVISAGADGTFRVDPARLDDVARPILDWHGNGAWMAQPFLPEVVSEGEYSLFYFGGDYSHAILKTPVAGDFRVQEEHGGIIRGIEPDTSLAEAGSRALAALPQPPLYCRVDLVRNTAGGWLVIEVELIEPSLYFRTSDVAADRFASAVDRWYRDAA